MARAGDIGKLMHSMHTKPRSLQSRKIRERLLIAKAFTLGVLNRKSAGVCVSVCVYK